MRVAVFSTCPYGLGRRLDQKNRALSNRCGTPKQLASTRPAPYAFAIWGVIYLLAAGQKYLQIVA